MGKMIDSYIDNLYSNRGLSNIMTVEHRSNNPKRDFLFCNKEQGKHIPVSPSEAFDMFDELAFSVEQALQGRKVVVVGFAETATAIGGYIADHLSSCVYYLQTTRENCAPMKSVIEFSEEHSHATEQYLYGAIESIPEFDYILFVDDEISTGKTIINFIEAFKGIKGGIDFGVASVCNWQNDDNKAIYGNMHIDTFALITGTLKDAGMKMNVNIETDVTEYAFNGECQCGGDCKCGGTCKCNEAWTREIHVSHYNPFMLERTGRVPCDNDYKNLVNTITTFALNFVGNAEKVLVLGTEEFMYIPMLVGEQIESWGKTVYCHATSRSSIDIIEGNDGVIYDGIVNKHKLHSAYDAERVTYIYNLREYDHVLIVSDANMTSEFKKDIVAALIDAGNKKDNITFLTVGQATNKK